MLVGNKRDRLGMILSPSAQKDQLKSDNCYTTESCRSQEESQKPTEFVSATATLPFMSQCSDNEDATAPKKTSGLSPESRLMLSDEKETTMNMYDEAHEEDQPKIVMRFTKRNCRKCYTRVTVADKKGKKVGRWTHTEHLRFVQAIMLYGRKNYWKVQEHVGSRTSY